MSEQIQSLQNVNSATPSVQSTTNDDATTIDRQLTIWLSHISIMKIFATERGRKFAPDVASAVADAEVAIEDFRRARKQITDASDPLVRDGFRLRRTSAVQQALKAHGMLCDLVKPATPSSIPFSVSEAEPSRSARRRFLAINYWLAGLSVVLLAAPYIWQFISGLFAGAAPAAKASATAADVAAKAAEAAAAGSTSVLATLPAVLSIVGAGAVGASFYNLYLIRTYLIDGSFDPLLRTTYYMRLALGSLAGLLLAIVIENLVTEQSGSRFTPTLCAIIGGFAIEAVNDIMIRLTETLRTLVLGRAEHVVKAERQALEAELRTAQIQSNMQHGRDLAQLLATAKSAGASGEVLSQIQALVDAALGTSPSKTNPPA
ncbi:MAG: hypothetical protein HEQ23_04965 [Tepidisphaera sp.]